MVSVAVIAWFPAVVNVAVNVCGPVIAVGGGNTVDVPRSELVKETVPLYFERSPLASSGFTVSPSEVPAVTVWVEEVTTRCVVGPAVAVTVGEPIVTTVAVPDVLTVVGPKVDVPALTGSALR